MGLNIMMDAFNVPPEHTRMTKVGLNVRNVQRKGSRVSKDKKDAQIVLLELNVSIKKARNVFEENICDKV